jgi:hypothetical protein
MQSEFTFYNPHTRAMAYLVQQTPQSFSLVHVGFNLPKLVWDKGFVVVLMFSFILW